MISSLLSLWAIFDNPEKEEKHKWLSVHERIVTPAMLKRLAASATASRDYKNGKGVILTLGSRVS